MKFQFQVGGLLLLLVVGVGVWWAIGRPGWKVKVGPGSTMNYRAGDDNY